MKKYLIILVLRVLENEADEDNPITQTRIAEMISAVYPCDRKTVGRNIKFLKSVGYPIVKTTRGFYMDKRRFSRAEVEFILGLIERAEAPEIDKEGLCQRLAPVLNEMLLL